MSEGVSVNTSVSSEPHADTVYIWNDSELNSKLKNLRTWKNIKKRILSKLPQLKFNEKSEIVIRLESSEGLFSGEFQGKERSGVGYFRYSNDVKYYGEWKNNLPHGQGFLRISKSSYYIGNFTKGRFNGYGDYYCDKANYYKGFWVNDVKHGKGLEKNTHGLYKGHFKDGQKHGKGLLKTKNFKFKGEFCLGKPAVGKLKLSDSSFSGIIDQKTGKGQGLLKVRNSCSYKKFLGIFTRDSFVRGEVLMKNNERLVLKNRLTV